MRWLYNQFSLHHLYISLWKVMRSYELGVKGPKGSKHKQIILQLVETVSRTSRTASCLSASLFQADGGKEENSRGRRGGWGGSAVGIGEEPFPPPQSPTPASPIRFSSRLYFSSFPLSESLEQTIYQLSREMSS